MVARQVMVSAWQHRVLSWADGEGWRTLEERGTDALDDGEVRRRCGDEAFRRRDDLSDVEAHLTRLGTASA